MKKMKVLAFMLLGFGLMFTACSEDESAAGVKGTGTGESVNVKISLSASDGITVRAASYTNSENGGITNVTEGYLRYILAVYDSNGDLVDQLHTTVTDNFSGSAEEFEVTLTDGAEYTAVGWSDFVTSEDGDDNHYDTSNFPEITYSEETITLNDESYDAYYASYTFTASSDGEESLTLKRPFAKLRIVATNADDSNTPDAIKITYDGLTRYTTFNAKDGSVSNESEEETYSAEEIPTYSAGEDATEGYMTILVDYILVDDDDAQSVSISYEATLSDATVGERTVSAVPIQRNYLTTVSGKALNSTESSTEEDNEKGSGTDSEDFDGNHDVDMDEIEPFNNIVVTASSNFTVGSEGASYEIKTDDSGESYILVTTNSSGAGNFYLTKSSDNGEVVLDPVNAPILCFRMTNLNDDTENYKQAHITIDTNDGYLLTDTDHTGDKYSGGLNDGNNKWNKRWYCDDGTELLIYHLSGDDARTIKNNTTNAFSALTEACSFATFQIKYADIQDTEGNAKEAEYSFYWFKSFASEDDLVTYLGQIGLEYSETAN